MRSSALTRKERVQRRSRSNSSISTSAPDSSHWVPTKRSSDLNSSTGVPAIGFCITRSRWGTFFFGLPPSSASAQIKVAGSVGRQLCARGPTITPSIGTCSARGTLASRSIGCPSTPHTSTSLGKRVYARRYE